MAQRIILHIGRHKCGSTALQRFLLRQREWLATQGFAYPLAGLEDIAHHPIARNLENERRPMPWRRHGRQHKDRGIASQQQMDAFVTALQDAPQTSAIVSSESFQNCKPKQVRQFLDKFEVTPVVYLREQAAYLRSAYCQRVHASTYNGTAQSFANDYFKADYQAFLQPWLKDFGKELVVRIYEKSQLLNDNITDDFVTNILKTPSAAPCDSGGDNDTNPSLSLEMLTLKLELNRRGFEVDHSNYRVLAGMSRGGTSFRLPLALSHWLREKSKSGNRWVAQNFFDREDLFGEFEPAQDQDLELSQQEFRRRLEALKEQAEGSITAPRQK